MESIYPLIPFHTEPQFSHLLLQNKAATNGTVFNDNNASIAAQTCHVQHKAHHFVSLVQQVMLQVQHPTASTYPTFIVQAHGYVASTTDTMVACEKMLPLESEKKNKVIRIHFGLQMTDILVHVHNLTIVHGNICQGSFVLAENGSIKVRSVEQIRYRAPEVIRGHINGNSQSDVYSLGLTLLHVMSGDAPFASLSDEDVEKTIIKTAELPYNMSIIAKKIPDCIDILQMCLSQPHKRPTARQLRTLFGLYALSQNIDATVNPNEPLGNVLQVHGFAATKIADECVKLLATKNWQVALTLLLANLRYFPNSITAVPANFTLNALESADMITLMQQLMQARNPRLAYEIAQCIKLLPVHAAVKGTIVLCEGNAAMSCNNVVAAFNCFREAAELGNAQAMQNLGHCFAHGLGVIRNVDHARQYYVLALQHGCVDAQDALDKLAKPTVKLIQPPVPQQAPNPPSPVLNSEPSLSESEYINYLVQRFISLLKQKTANEPIQGIFINPAEFPHASTESAFEYLRIPTVYVELVPTSPNNLPSIDVLLQQFGVELCAKVSYSSSTIVTCKLIPKQSQANSQLYHYLQSNPSLFYARWNHDMFSRVCHTVVAFRNDGFIYLQVMLPQYWFSDSVSLTWYVQHNKLSVPITNAIPIQLDQITESKSFPVVDASSLQDPFHHSVCDYAIKNNLMHLQAFLLLNKK